MTFDPKWLQACVGLLPVLCFLAALVLLDSYKLVRLRMVFTVLVAGGVIAGICYAIAAFIINATGLGFEDYSRYVAPLIEESLKAAVVIALIRMRRIGFLVDASVLGFAVGTGFATVENVYYLGQLADVHSAAWIVRGFGTAIMHGGTQAIFAALALTNADSRGKLDARAVLPPLVLVILVHAAFNQFMLSPIIETVLVLAIIPPLLVWVYVRSEGTLRGWLGSGFDADQELLNLLGSDTFSQSPAGQYLFKLRERFPGKVVADLLCYLQLYAELALRAKGILMMRENGIEATIDDETRSKLEEMAFLERSVGRAGLLTLQPLMHTSRRDLWQLHLLGK
ncbi:MAG: PrsW family glutamic-type intramembrane protease [Rhodanobacteraceae bacterium]